MTLIQQDLSDPVRPTPSIIEVPRYVGGTISPASDIGPVSCNVATGAQSWNDFLIAQSSGVTLTNESPTTATLTPEGGVTRITGLGASIILTNAYGLGRRINLNYNYVPGGAPTIAAGYVTGSHPWLSWNIIQPLLDTAAPTNLFSAVNHTTFTYTPNAGCWARAWDFSGVSVWNSRSGNFARAATLITRRHIWCAWHYRLYAGDTVKFRGSNGVIHTYTVLATIPGQTFPTGEQKCFSVGDLCIAVLDRNVDATITDYPIAGQWLFNIETLPTANPEVDTEWPYQSAIELGSPGEFLGYWLGATNQPAWCGFRLDQNRHAYLLATATPQAAGLRATGLACDFEGVSLPIWMQVHHFCVGPNESPLPDFMSEYNTYANGVAVGGDSGSPVFYPTSGSDLAIASVHSTSQIGHPANGDVLNALIQAADANAGVTTGFTVTVAPDPTL